MRVLLAPSEVPSNCPKYWDKLMYPLLGSPKLDGIRGVIDDLQNAMSRTWIQLPSKQIQEDFTRIPWLDGEFIEGCETDFDVYNRTQSHVMSDDKPGDIRFHLFDYAHPDWHDRYYEDRLAELRRIMEQQNSDLYRIVPQTLIENREQLERFENEELEKGFEGIMLKTPWGRYKNGRATINEGIIYKLKRFVDAEGVVVGFVERMVNNNEKTRDERGYAKRSSSQAGKEAAGMLGKFKVDFNGEIINVAPGKFTHPELLEIWENKEKYVGALLKFRYFAHGIKDQPRHARAIGWRSKIDT